jgi:hypothetical protein
VVAVEMSQEDGLDGARIDAQSVQVGEQRRARIEKDSPVDDDAGVVTLNREGGPRAEEGEPQAIVTPGFR